MSFPSLKDQQPPLKQTYTIESFVGLCTRSNVWKVSSVNRGEFVTTGGLYRPTHLFSTLRIAPKKSQTVFFFFGGGVRVTGGRGLYGVSESGGVSWVQGSYSLGEKLLSSLAERALMLQNRLPDGRSWKRLWEGWVGSFTILVASLEHRARKMSRMEGGGALMIFSAVFTVRWRVLWSAALQFPYQTVIQLVSTLSMVPLLKVVRMGGGRLALFSRWRKFRPCWAFLESDVVLVVQVRSSVMCTPRNLGLLTLSTVELPMVSGGWSPEFCLNSITTSFVLLTLRDRLFAPHHLASCANSSL